MPTVLEYKYNKTFILKERTIGGTHANSGTKRIKGIPLGELEEVAPVWARRDSDSHAFLREGGPWTDAGTFSSGSADVRKGRFEGRSGECVRAW